MANISAYLTKILSAVYGEEVRGSIHDALRAMNEESSQAVRDSAQASKDASAAKESAKAYAEEASQSAESAGNFADRAAGLVVKTPEIRNGTWWVYDPEKDAYLDSGKPVTGDAGPQGEAGKDFRILDYFADISALETAVPSPEPGAAYGIGTETPYDIYVFSATQGWVNNGPIQGPAGPVGPQGAAGISGVYIGTKPPSDPNIKVWIDPSGDA